MHRTDGERIEGLHALAERFRDKAREIKRTDCADLLHRAAAELDEAANDLEQFLADLRGQGPIERTERRETSSAGEQLNLALPD